MKPIHPTAAQLRALRKSDPALAAAMRRVPAYPGFPHPSQRGSHFQSLARAVVYQQLSGNAAGTIYGRVCALTEHRGFPRPADALAMGEAPLRSAGLSRAKTRCILDLADRVDAGRLKLRSIGRLPDEEIIERLTEVWGIGVWSAQMFLIFRLGRLDVMPSGDLGVQEGLRILDGLEERPSPAQLDERAQSWKPLRSVASWTLYRICDE